VANGDGRPDDRRRGPKCTAEPPAAARASNAVRRAPTTRRRFALGLLLAPLAARTAAAQESNFGGGRPEERYFTVEAALGHGRRGPVAEGYVMNRYDVHATRVRLALQPLDAAGRPLGNVIAYVGDVPARNRAFFHTAVPPGTASVRAGVESFEWSPRGGG
jgi:hypothetical protein